MSSTSWDVIIIGGGPAGLSAALTLGRCRRNVLVCDVGQPRNRASHHLHSFITRDGISPREFLRIAREQLQPYTSVQLRDALVLDARMENDGFEVTLHTGETHWCRKLLLATGVVDHLPEIENVEKFYGRSVHHCPYCDAWEWREQPMAVYGKGEKGAGLALMLCQWTDDIVLLTDGEPEITPDYSERLARRHIRICEERIARLEGDEEHGALERVVLKSGEVIERRALFFNTGQNQRSMIPMRLGCDFTEKGGVVVGEHEVATQIPGLYVAGDASRDVQLVIVAAAEGTKAAFAINKALLSEAGLA